MLIWSEARLRNRHLVRAGWQCGNAERAFRGCKDFACSVRRGVPDLYSHAGHPPAAGIAHEAFKSGADERILCPSELRQRQAKNEAEQNGPMLKCATGHAIQAEGEVPVLAYCFKS